MPIHGPGSSRTLTAATAPVSSAVRAAPMKRSLCALAQSVGLLGELEEVDAERGRREVLLGTVELRLRCTPGRLGRAAPAWGG
jgi:hypothetical protein